MIVALKELEAATQSEALSKTQIWGDAVARVAREIWADGFAFVPGADVTRLLSASARLAWPAFAASWDDLGLDKYMADGGRYRRRRHASFQVTPERIALNPRRAHYQGRDHNRLNGGVHRWFDSVAPDVTSSDLTSEVLGICRSVFQRLEGDATSQKRLVEMHQFRIEPSAFGGAKPTPEGMHRDGVKLVCILLIGRVNVDQGVTTIADRNGFRLGSFTLQHAFDTLLIDDRRVMHGVTPISRVDPMHPGHRDVLVLTFD